MQTYLTIMVTALVATQVIRVTQNALQIRRQKKLIDKDLAWIRDNDISERDFETQRRVFQKLDKAFSFVEDEER